MNRQDGLARVQEVVVRLLAIDPEKVTEEARLREDLGADSLDLLEVVAALEDQFQVSIPEDRLEGVKTVGQALDLALTAVSR